MPLCGLPELRGHMRDRIAPIAIAGGAGSPHTEHVGRSGNQVDDGSPLVLLVSRRGGSSLNLRRDSSAQVIDGSCQRLQIHGWIWEIRVIGHFLNNGAGGCNKLLVGHVSEAGQRSNVGTHTYLLVG